MPLVAAHACPPCGGCSCLSEEERVQECIDDTIDFPNVSDKIASKQGDIDPTAVAMNALHDLNAVLIARNTSLVGFNNKQLQKDLDVVVACWEQIASDSLGKENAAQLTPTQRKQKQRLSEGARSYRGARSRALVHASTACTFTHS